MAHNFSSFSYKIINKNIRDILDARSRLDNTVQVAMPFVKATTTIQHSYLDNDLSNMGFTLGLHGINEDVKYQDMYHSQDGLTPLIGYTYTDKGTTKRIYAKNPATEELARIGQIFDPSTELLTYPNTKPFVRIPPPGITNVKISRGARGGKIGLAEIQLNIPSLIQLESLHRTFLIPGVGLVLEWGQQFAPYDKTNPIITRETSTTSEELRAQLYDVSDYMFPWYNRPELLRVLDALARRSYGLDDILEKYVYPSNGQYMWMFGRIGNFSVKSNADGSFNATVKIAGQSEDEWAYLTRTTVVPRKDSSSKYFCASDTNSVRSYFTNTISDLGGNLKSLLDTIVSNKSLPPSLADWKNHVVIVPPANQVEGDPQPTTQTPATTEKTFAEEDDAYFMTWRFFVNVVINDPNYGVRNIFARAGMDDDKLSTIGLLKSYADGDNRENKDVGNVQKIDDPKESYVGMNKYLRSIDPSTLLIVNKQAVDLARANPQYQIASIDEDLLRDTEFSNALEKATVSFDKSTDFDDRGFLSSGVWINHKAVISAMIGADTILRGVSNLLERMNAATMNYWQLALDVSEGDSVLNEPNSYSVVDANWFESSDKAVAEFIENVHVFNKYVRVDNNGTLVGSDVLECTLDLSLPKRLFAQIATLGIIQPSEIAQLSATEQKVGDVVNPTDPARENEENFAMKISDPNNSLARMFGIATISELNFKTGRSMDLTVLPVDERQALLNSTCGKANTQLVAGTGGQGFQVANVSTPQAGSNEPADKKTAFEQATAKEKTAICQKCKPCLEARATEASSTDSGIGKATVSGTTMEELPSLKFEPEQIGQQVSAQLLKDVNDAIITAGGGDYIVNVNSAVRYGTSSPSRHGRGRALDLGTVFQRSTGREYSIRDATSDASYDRPNTGGRVVQELFDRVARILQQKGYKLNVGESGNSKVILWKTTIGGNHFNHMHVSNLELPQQVPTPPPTQPDPFAQTQNPFGVTRPSPTPAVTGTPQSTDVCSDVVIEEIGRSAGGTGSDLEKGNRACAECERATRLIAQTKQTAQSSIEVAIRKFSGYRHVPKYVEIFPEYMVAEISRNSDDNKANAFGAAPGSLSISGDITIPGINGLRIGELFWIDRIPAFYKAFGAFQVLSLEDVIGIDGWQTKVHSRFNYLGAVWRNSMFRKLGIQTSRS
jgi:hypothetical protein